MLSFKSFIDASCLWTQNSLTLLLSSRSIQSVMRTNDFFRFRCSSFKLNDVSKMLQWGYLRCPIRTGSWGICWRMSCLISVSKMMPTAQIMRWSCMMNDSWVLWDTLNPCQQLSSLRIIYFVLFWAFFTCRLTKVFKRLIFTTMEIWRKTVHLSLRPSAGILGSVHSPALRCDHNEVSERLEDVAGTKHVRRSNGVWILKPLLIVLHFQRPRGWQEVTAGRVWQS